MDSERIYIAIDLKSYYASVECVARGLDPLTTNLVVADASRTEKTICLAVTPALKSYGIGGRPRLFEVVQKVEEINKQRLHYLPNKIFAGKSYDAKALAANANLALDYITAPPRMALYLQKNLEIYNIYLSFFTAEDVHVYSIDEVFIDITPYLAFYKLGAEPLAKLVVSKILQETGITATVGIGSNMYLAKIAMDIVAKKMPADANGLRIASLNEASYRRLLWSHRPLTDFWRIGRGSATKLEANGLLTMGDIARCSLGNKSAYYNEGLLYKLFGVNAELLIDHAWGYEPCTIASIRKYVPKSTSLSSGQVLPRAYKYSEGKLIVQEMADMLVLDLVKQGLVTNQLVLHIGYDVENTAWAYAGTVARDHYGRLVPLHAHGSIGLGGYSSSTKLIISKLVALYEQIVDKTLLIRRVNIAAVSLKYEQYCQEEQATEQLSLFSAEELGTELNEEELLQEAKERYWQRMILKLHNKYGKNILLKGYNLLEGAKTRERNEQIGGHKA